LVNLPFRIILSDKKGVEFDDRMGIAWLGKWAAIGRFKVPSYVEVKQSRFSGWVFGIIAS
jgi:hypothetical protein